MGYHRAGFEVVGVDINPQPRYPFEFHQGDALEFLAAHGHEFDVIHASPPCQGFTRMQNIAKNAGGHLDLLTPIRPMLEELGKPYVIENVEGAPIRRDITLCGSMFGMTALDTDGVLLQLRRHRIFETNMPLLMPGPCNHLPGVLTASVMGHGGGWPASYKGKLGGGYTPHTSVCRELMGMDWTNKRELSESIPPVYTEFIGGQLMHAVAVAL
jgi:DNA (cytosine-5)-methyltransferase 1